MASIQDSFINLRNDLKTWCTVNFRSKANKSNLTASDNNYFKFDVDSNGEYGFMVNENNVKKFKPFNRAYTKRSVTKFNYTGSTQEFTAPETGYYRLEVYGAQGGSYNDNTNHISYKGGYGGYAYGNVSLTKGQTIYVVVGGKGSDFTTNARGGYNGGGNSNASKYNCTGGGGCTHIGTFNNTLASHGSTSGLYIVAGGGGGASDKGVGGYGGGLTGGDSPITDVYGVKPTGGTQSAGGTGWSSSSENVCPGKFGQGGGSNYNPYGGAGGGGLYGGGGARQSGSGGGGSGYVGGVTNGETLSSFQRGDGMAKITYLGNSETVLDIPDPFVKIDPSTHVHTDACYITYAKNYIRHVSDTTGYCSGCGAYYATHYYECSKCHASAGWARTSNCTCGQTPSTNNTNDHTHTVTELGCGYE